MILAGCSGCNDKDPETSSPGASAADARPSPQGPARAQDGRGANGPAPGVFTIAGSLVRFAPCRARLDDRGAAVAVQLSAEETELGPGGEGGNSFFFDLLLEIEDAGKLDGAEWRFKALDREPAESPDGFSLDGGRSRLQPYDVTVRFGVEGAREGVPPSDMAATLSGQFLLFTEEGGAVAQKTVDVKGTIRAGVEK